VAFSFSPSTHDYCSSSSFSLASERDIRLMSFCCGEHDTRCVQLIPWAVPDQNSLHSSALTQAGLLRNSCCQRTRIARQLVLFRPRGISTSAHQSHLLASSETD